MRPVLAYLRLNQWVYERVEYVKFFNQSRIYGNQLKCLIKSEGLENSKRPLFCCLRNEMHRMPKFIEYYRNMGVDHFLFIDNGSIDGFVEYMKEQNDCSVWYTTDSYKNSNFGMWWCNYLLKKYGSGKWCITVDPDEFLVYPMIESRTLVELTDHLDYIGQKSLFTVMIDAYSDKRVDETILTNEDDPMEVCPYFDRFNYTQQIGGEFNSCWVQGGVRMRKFFNQDPAKAPAQNKIPLVKWDRSYNYLSSMHHTNIEAINCTVNGDDRFLSGVLFHYKYVGTLKEKVEEEMQRKEHYESGSEYEKYEEHGFNVLYDPHWSIKYQDTSQLVELKLMHRGDWF